MARTIWKNGKVHGFEVGHAEIWELDNDLCGFCIACGEMNYGACEPDARNYTCTQCNEAKVFGASELVLRGFITITDEAFAEEV